ncbi:MAG: hypothetical protein ACYTDY_05610 [Planctomycetota bacterium]|jgi:hypothetical protein
MQKKRRSKHSGPKWWRRIRRSFRHGDGVFWAEVAFAIAVIAAISYLAVSLF